MDKASQISQYLFFKTVNGMDFFLSSARPTDIISIFYRVECFQQSTELGFLFGLVHPSWGPLAPRGPVRTLSPRN